MMVLVKLYAGRVTLRDRKHCDGTRASCREQEAWVKRERAIEGKIGGNRPDLRGGLLFWDQMVRRIQTASVVRTSSLIEQAACVRRSV